MRGASSVVGSDDAWHVTSHMALKIDPAIRKRLEHDGNWIPFCYRRSELIHKGESRQEADRTALKEFGIPKEEADALRASKPEGERRDGKTPQEVRAGEAVFRKQTREEGRVAKSVFEGKDCSFREEVIWVANNVHIRGVKPKDAPSSSAWTMLNYARSSGTNLGYFLRDFYAKIHISEAKGDAQDEGPFKDDGKDFDLPDWLRAASE